MSTYLKDLGEKVSESKHETGRNSYLVSSYKIAKRKV